MNREVLLLLVDHRRKIAADVQKILTDYGCYIKTRLGLHDSVLNQCSETGLIFLELAGDKDKHTELANAVNAIDGVDGQLVNLSVTN